MLFMYCVCLSKNVMPTQIVIIMLHALHNDPLANVVYNNVYNLLWVGGHKI